MRKMHHDFSLDKDTPESIQQLLEQDSDPAPQSQHGLPAGDRLDNYVDPENVLPDATTGLMETDETVEMHGSGLDRPVPGEFRSKK